MNGESHGRAGPPWRLVWAVFGFVLILQLLLVARTGTDLPFQDQWDVEGRWLYPAWREGNLHATDLLRPHNEHRIVWTYGLDLVLFAANGQWDPLVQLAAGAVLRAAVAAGLAGLLVRGAGPAGRIWGMAGVALLFLPHLAWQNALWGFQSSVYFAVGFSVAAFALLSDAQRSRGRLVGGIAAAVAAQLAMGPGLLVPVALLGLAGVRAVEGGGIYRSAGRLLGTALGLIGLAWTFHVSVPAHAALHPENTGQFFNALGRALAWPHVGQPVAAVVLNLPLVWVVLARLGGRHRAAEGEDFILLLGGWAVALSVAMAWTRGGGHEFDAGVPSRYVDFLVLVPLANSWCVVVLLREAAVRRRPAMRLLAAAWGVFLLVGWLGLSAEVMRGLVLPRMRDREAPVRLAVAFQRSDDAAVFAGQPLLLIPHPNLGAVRAVLHDPVMQGALPPSLQPGRPMGPLSRMARWLLGRQ